MTLDRRQLVRTGLFSMAAAAFGLPALAAGREQDIVVICRTGKRSALAADAMMRMGFGKVVSLKTGVRGWIDYEQPLVDGQGAVLNADAADGLLVAQVRPEQRKPRR